MYNIYIYMLYIIEHAIQPDMLKAFNRRSSHSGRRFSPTRSMRMRKPSVGSACAKQKAMPERRGFTVSTIVGEWNDIIAYYSIL